MSKIKITIIGYYEPEPESYEYPEGRDDLTIEEMAAQDRALIGTQVWVADAIEWCDPDSIQVTVEPA
jgi:hypothetical protein